uniref:Uncharacterized protein n=1 Tax=viral metagenome TaxID=1070528 RepID=A0A6C0BJ89_9ZZZZ
MCCNFPRFVALYRPSEDGYQIIFNDEGSLKIMTSVCGEKVSYIVQKSKDYPLDDMFQVFVNASGKELYYWPTGYELRRIVPRSWNEKKSAIYPIFQFLNPPVGLTHTVIKTSGSSFSSDTVSCMRILRSAAIKERNEFRIIT